LNQVPPTTITQQPPRALDKSPSQPPDLAASPSIKSNSANFPTPRPAANSPLFIDLAKLQDQISQELSKVKTSQESLAVQMPSYTCQPSLQQVKSTFSQPSIHQQGNNEKGLEGEETDSSRMELVKSPSIKSGETSPELSKLEDQLKAAAAMLSTKSNGMPKIRSFSGDNSLSSSSSGKPALLDLAAVQEQLNAELLKAKQSQSMLERTLIDSNYNGVAASIVEAFSGDAASIVSIAQREELQAELVATRQTQVALENMLAGTVAIATAASTTAEVNDPVKPAIPSADLSPRESITQELFANAGSDADNEVGSVITKSAASINANFPTTTEASFSPRLTNDKLSLSISQQEVDAGNLKEYIPPPTYFSQNIPSVILVYYAPEQGGDFSVAAQSMAAQSHHTMNLKRSDGQQNISQKWLFDCCGGDTTNDAQQKKVKESYDYDTIETYDDDYTLNSRPYGWKESYEDDTNRHWMGLA